MEGRQVNKLYQMHDFCLSRTSRPGAAVCQSPEKGRDRYPHGKFSSNLFKLHSRKSFEQTYGHYSPGIPGTWLAIRSLFSPFHADGSFPVLPVGRWKSADTLQRHRSNRPAIEFQHCADRQVLQPAYPASAVLVTSSQTLLVFCTLTSEWAY